MIVIQSPALMILTSTTVTVTNAYCPPNVISCSLQDTINNFILAGESGTIINDTGTGCSSNAYDNRTSESVTLLAKMSYTVIVSTEYSSSEQFAIWIDFNHDFLFESSERVVYGSMNSTYNTPITITIPAIGSGATIGVHRMRASLAFANTPNPCCASISYGETHDYTVVVNAYTCKLFQLWGKSLLTKGPGAQN